MIHISSNNVRQLVTKIFTILHPTILHYTTLVDASLRKLLEKAAWIQIHSPSLHPALSRSHPVSLSLSLSRPSH
jgi:hypothetical protein